MKQAIVRVPFFLNDNNMEYLLKGNLILNLDEVHDNMLFKNGYNIYVPRQSDPNRPIDMSEYPNQSDTIVAKAIRYINGEVKCLEIELIDSLYYHKLREPCIKLNGYCIIEGNTIMITKITRMTLADRQPIVANEIF